jgi:TonB family protein
MRTTIVIALLLVWQVGAQESEWIPVRVHGLSYPRVANQAQIMGSVALRAQLSPDGSVIEVKVLSGNKLLARAATENLKPWRFGRACGSGKEMMSRSIDFRYTFKLKGVSTRPETESIYEHPGTVIVLSAAQHWNP